MLALAGLGALSPAASFGASVGGDFDGDGKTDIAVWRPSDGSWSVRDQWVVPHFGVGGDVPVPGDYDGDHKADVAVFRPADGSWSIMNQGTAYLGQPGDIPVPGDYDGDGKTDVAVWRPADGTWRIDGKPTVTYGVAGDVPVPADFNGDGKVDIAVWRPSDGSWSIMDQGTVPHYGVAGDIPVPGDFDGDGKADIAVWRPSDGTWNIQGQLTLAYGVAGDVPMPGDFNGDGKSDIAVWRPTDGSWSIYAQGTGWYGVAGDIPLGSTLARVNRPKMAAGDFSGDGLTDFGMWRPLEGAWSIRSVFALAFGQPGDRAVPADYDGDGRLDVATFRRRDHSWSINAQRIAYNLAGDFAVPADYDSDGKADVATFRPSDGAWIIENQPTVFYGAPGDYPVPGDYNGDRKIDIAVFRPSDHSWSIRGQRVAYNLIGDIPVPGDYDGDGKTDVALYRKSDGAWVIENQPTVFYGAQAGDIPAPGDYNGDGKTDIAIYRPSDNSWSIYGQTTDHYGQALDQPLVSTFADTAPPTANVTGGIYDARNQPSMTNGEISVAGIDDLTGVTDISVIGQKADGSTGQITGTSRSCAAPLCTPYGLDLSTVIDPVALNWQTGNHHLSVQLTDNAGNATTVASWDVQYYPNSWAYGGADHSVNTADEIAAVIAQYNADPSDAAVNALLAALSPGDRATVVAAIPSAESPGSSSGTAAEVDAQNVDFMGDPVANAATAFDNNLCPTSSPCGSYDGSAAAAYAHTYYATGNGNYPDYYDDNCTNFVSQALRAGGFRFLRYNRAENTGVTGSNSWWVQKLSSNPTAWKTTRSWSVAPSLYSHLVNTNLGAEIPGPTRSFRPGDVLFYDLHGSGIDHASIVTTVKSGQAWIAQSGAKRYERLYADQMQYISAHYQNFGGLRVVRPKYTAVNI